MYERQTKLLLDGYHAGITWGGKDHEAALQDAVETAFPKSSDEDQAELYTRLVERWEQYRTAFAARKVWVHQEIRSWQSSIQARYSKKLRLKNQEKTDV